MSDYTPGSWFVMPEDPPMRRSRLVMDQPNLESDGPNMALAYVWGRTDEIAEANARLVAAAPDLLAACTALLDIIGAGEINDANRDDPETANSFEAVCMGLHAIRKAGGREG